MPARKTAKGKTVRAKRRSGKGKPQAPGRLTVKNAQKFLQGVRDWWDSLSKDMEALKKLLDQLPVGVPLTVEVIEEIERLLKEITQPRSCPPGVQH